MPSDQGMVLARDFNAQAGTLFVQFGKAQGSGYKPRHVALAEEGQRWFAGHSAGSRGDEPMFRRGTAARTGRKEALAGFDGWTAYDESTPWSWPARPARSTR
jgi:hypothetical protein